MDESSRNDLGVRLAAELDRARILLEDLAVQLCIDAVVFERHAGPLQRFDQVTQMIGEVAKVLRAVGSEQAALTDIRLEAMRERMIGAGR